MAKSKSFFGLRTGSTKSHTYQVLRGEQITKDRVYDVANPQTVAQMNQRLKLPIVANARAILKTLVNHSFEGVTYGDQSLKKFSQLNLAKGALDIYAYVPKGGMDCGVANLIISKGSLPEVQCGIYTTGMYKGIKFSNSISAPTSAITKADEITSSNLNAAQTAAIAKMLGYEDGDQLTFLLMYQGADYKYGDADDPKTAYYHRFVISRLMFNTTDGDSRWKIEKKADSEVLYLSDGYIDLSIDWTEGSNEGVATITYQGEKNAVAGTVILSRKNDTTYQRSSQRLVCDSSISSPTFEDVVSTYEKEMATSNRYLNSGLEGVDIPGGETTA